MQIFFSSNLRMYVLVLVYMFMYTLVSSRVSLTSWGEVISLALDGQTSSNGSIIKIPYWVEVLLQ